MGSNANVAIIYHSSTGTTRQLAEAVCVGASKINKVSARKYELVGKDIIEGRFRNKTLYEHLEKADAIVFGSPTYMGSVSAQFKAFADATGEFWADRVWRNKIAAGFTIGTNLNGEQLGTLQYMQLLANQHGMLWAGVDIPGNHHPRNLNRLGAHSGLVAHSTTGEVDPLDLETANHLGERVAFLALNNSKHKNLI
jgi:multimeric flavodoxin WrbA